MSAHSGGFRLAAPHESKGRHTRGRHRSRRSRPLRLIIFPGLPVAAVLITGFLLPGLPQAAASSPASGAGSELIFTQSPEPDTAFTAPAPRSAPSLALVKEHLLLVLHRDQARAARAETAQDRRQEARADAQQAAQAAAAAAAAQQAQQAAVPPQSASAPSGGTVSTSGMSAFEACVINNESGGNPRAVNPTSGAGGLFQFLPSTWASLGYSGLPQYAPVSEQYAAFAKLYAEAGTSPWSGDGCA